MERGTAAEGDVVVARREHILEIARSAGSVAVEDLAERLGVTPQTIRKDLNVLAGQSLLSRIQLSFFVHLQIINFHDPLHINF